MPQARLARANNWGEVSVKAKREMDNETAKTARTRETDNTLIAKEFLIIFSTRGFEAKKTTLFGVEKSFFSKET